MKNDLLHTIALTQLDGIGYFNAKKILTHFNTAKAFFENPYEIDNINRLSSKILSKKNIETALKIAEAEVNFIEKYNIQPLLISDKKFPNALKECADAPIVLYTKGNVDFNSKRILSIVGTRKITNYGKQVCKELIENLPKDVLVLSGLAYGVDIEAHKSAIDYEISTAAVLAHGLDRIYPAAHSGYAKQMLENGALISDFISNTNPDRENFPKRNRIVAGMAEATIVIESADKGGSLITANLANAYDRDVFAFPGKSTDLNSRGCNSLIKNQKAQLVESSEDILTYLGWNNDNASISKQITIPIGLTETEQLIFDHLIAKGKTQFDVLSTNLNIPVSELSVTLLTMEFSGLINTLPGKNYDLV